jgi:hypothetical protein
MSVVVRVVMLEGARRQEVPVSHISVAVAVEAGIQRLRGRGAAMATSPSAVPARVMFPEEECKMKNAV